MKQTISLILIAILLFAFVPAASAAGTDYTIVIRGGQTSGSMETVDGDSLLKVDVYFEGVTDEKLLTALAFDLSFDANKLEYATNSQERGVSTIYSVDKNGTKVADVSMLVNDANAGNGTLRFVLASDYGCKIKSNQPLISLYFYLGSDLAAGTSIGFSVGGEIEAESVKRSAQNGSGAYTKRSVGANLTPYTLSEATPSGVAVSGEIAFNASDVTYKGSTAYVIYNKKAHTPRVTVKNKDTGKTVDPKYYSVSYQNNTAPGTATVTVTFRHGYKGTCSAIFKIYLPATTATSVKNVENGITVSWEKVDGAKGYVIYRRAWNLISSGWTSFERWNNTTATEWTDTKVYAGTRYQYGIKAYPSDPMDNYNLGIVGPLKTTVRITTRKLNSVTAGSRRMTIKWTGSSVFTGYQIQYATNKSFTENAKAIKITNPKTYATTVKSLKSGKTYYVRIRSYHEFEGMTYFGQWSNVLSCKVK
ncbi:MAG: fibronectin type III domain-containing protein [Clostridia bacterium]|nr:fibronectin type III domain-containing protein [Clostridia bacterium]